PPELLLLLFLKTYTLFLQFRSKDKGKMTNNQRHFLFERQLLSVSRLPCLPAAVQRLQDEGGNTHQN
ncbi:MAG TPA: hypothetical protein DEQ09_06070, partial [Bacteroidales bacterium]|nr:hypothetical protein [Bacteroidales bacterium]